MYCIGPSVSTPLHGDDCAVCLCDARASVDPVCKRLSSGVLVCRGLFRGGQRFLVEGMGPAYLLHGLRAAWVFHVLLLLPLELSCSICLLQAV